jgi:hypothetical protein
MKYISALSLLLAPLLLLAPALAAHATTVTPAAGTFTTTVTSLVPIRTADGNTAFDVAGTIVVTGTFSGSGPITFALLVRATGQDNFLGQFTCSPCRVEGRSGSIVVGFTATGVFGVGNALNGQYTILSGTGGLANLHGQGPFSGIQTPTGFQGVYSGKTLFSP